MSVFSTLKYRIYCNASNFLHLLIKDVRITAFFTSFLLSFWMVYADDVINNDGILYLQVADLFSRGDWQGACQLYQWCFYSLLIAFVHQISGFGLEISAHLLNALFSAFMVIAFISLVKEITEDQTTTLLAALIILFHPELNELRPEVVRDHGYWVFFLLACLYFIRYNSNPGYRSGFAWGINILIATLFRIEGIVFLLILPAFLLVRRNYSFTDRIYAFFRLYLLPCIFLGVFAVFKLMSGGTIFGSAKNFFSSMSQVSHLKMFLHGISDKIFVKADMLRNTILSPYAQEYALYIAVFVPFIIIFVEMIQALTPIYTIFLFWPTFGQKSRRISWDKLNPLVWVACVCMTILVVFVFARFLLQQRFTIPIVFILLVFLSFRCRYFLDVWKERRGMSFTRRCALYIVLVLFLANGIEGLLFFPGSKAYIKEAGQWLKNNVPPEANLYSNSNKLLYYSGRLHESRSATDISLDTIVAKKKWDQYDYLALLMKNGSAAEKKKISESIGVSPVKEFRNSKKDEVLVYPILGLPN